MRKKKMERQKFIFKKIHNIMICEIYIKQTLKIKSDQFEYKN